MLYESDQQQQYLCVSNVALFPTISCCRMRTWTWSKRKVCSRWTSSSNMPMASWSRDFLGRWHLHSKLHLHVNTFYIFTETACVGRCAVVYVCVCWSQSDLVWFWNIQNIFLIIILSFQPPWVWHELLPYSAIMQTRNWMIEFHDGIGRMVGFTINITVVINSSCDFDTFVCILYECFASAQRSYT